MADIAHITLPNGDVYDLKDSTARSGLSNKVDKVTGKGLSTNDYTTTEKNKLAGIATGAEANVQSDWNVTDTSSDAFIKNKPTIPTDTWKSFYGTCTTAAATKDKAVTVSSDQNFSLRVGAIVGVKFSYTNSYSSATANPITLNVNSTGAKNIWYNTTHSGAGNTGISNTIYGTANRYTWYMYDGTYWVWIHYGVISNSNTVPSAQCETAAGTAAKAATCTNFALKTNSYLHFNIRYANTSATALTMDVNSTGAKAIYINGTASSTSNYTLPAGSYIAFYNGTYWDFRTDGKLPASITGDAATVNGHTVASDVPANAKFTDTTYSEATTSASGLMSSSDKTKLNGIATGAEVNVQPDWNVTDTSSDAFIKNKPTIPTVPGAATTTPKMDGTAAVGSSTKYAKEDHVHPSDTTKVSHADYDPSYGIGTANLIMQGRVDYTRANRLAFLPADQIIVEQTIDGGTTWTDAGVTDATKALVFSGVAQGNIALPRINGKKSTLCGIRITFTAMKYNVPSGTAETSKYNYWNSTYVQSAERYCQLSRLWFWLGANSDRLSISAYRATGANPNTWTTIFNTDFGATGWSGSDWISFGASTFGGGTNQTGQPWNYRLTFFSRLIDGQSSFASDNVQNIYRIYGYGEGCWTAPNSLMQVDHLYSMDVDKNATFPAKVTATGGFSGNLTGNVTGNLTGNASGVATQGNGTTDVARHVWFSDGTTETKRAHDDDFKYNPVTNVLTVGNVSGKVNNHTVNSDVPANAVFTDTTYSQATQSAAGLMSAADKTKLDNLPTSFPNFYVDPATMNLIQDGEIQEYEFQLLDGYLIV